MRVFFQTFGCKVNQVETQLLRQRVLAGGWASVSEPQDADVCVINSCSVTEEADRKCRQLLRRIRRQNDQARIILTGCYATRAPVEIERLFPGVEIVSNMTKGTIFGCTGLIETERQAASQIRDFAGHSRAFVKVQDGCRSSCTYCVIPQTRQGLWCKPAAAIVEEARDLVAHGYQEVVLTGIRLGRYLQREHDGSCVLLPDVLRSICQLSGTFRVRLSSFEITEVTEALIDCLCSETKICRHLHVPLQSGDDEVLKRMGRWYTTAYFSERIHAIRKRLGEVAITTDVIVGFPGESQKQFENTAGFIRNLGFSGLHVFPFSARPGTKANSYRDRCEASVVQERVRQMSLLDRDLRRRFAERFLSSEREVLIEAHTDPPSGYTGHYVRVQVQGSFRGTVGLSPIWLQKWQDGNVVGLEKQLI